MVQLLSELGYDTGYKSDSPIWGYSNAGLEWNISVENAPYIIKSPALCEKLDDILKRGKVVIDYAIVPIRNLFDAAESRRNVVSNAGANVAPNALHGGLFGTKIASEQELVLARKRYSLMHTLSKHEIPLMLLNFPMIIDDSEYLYRNLHTVFPSMDKERFDVAFAKICKPELVHKFE